MSSEDRDSAGDEPANPFSTPKEQPAKLDKRSLWCREDLAELRALVEADRRQEAANLLKQLSLHRCIHSDRARELGDLCARLGYTVLAGRCWYLEEHQTPEMQAACREFERSCGENPQLIAESLGSWIDEPVESYARRRIDELQSQAAPIHSRDKELGRVARNWWGRVVGLGCLLIFAAMVIVFLIGLATISSLFFGADPWRR